ncbi:MAG: DUF2865 domain-containing protein [Pseudomonadota bacterium]
MIAFLDRVWGVRGDVLRDVAEKFSAIAVFGGAAIGSAAVFTAVEGANFDAWSSTHYSADENHLRSAKVVKLPPVDDAMATAFIVETRDDEFSQSLRHSGKWRRRSGGSSKSSSKYIRKVRRSNLIGSNGGDLFLDPFSQYAAPKRQHTPQSGLYRTMCVRSCDGFMWPVSFSTSKRNLGVDENVCRSSCAAPTRLYYYENPGQEPADMIDRRGRRYSALPTAWRFQQQHVSSCKCRPDPWEGQALAKHKMYATLQAEGRLKSYVRKTGSKARRIARRSSIGYVVANSSVTQLPTSAREEPSVRKRKGQKSKRSRSFANARGFGAPKVKVYRPKSSKVYRRRVGDFQRAFQTNR